MTTISLFTTDADAPARLLDKTTLGRDTKDLPFFVRKALGFAAGLQRGSLDVALPDGRRFVFRAAEDGPAAVLFIRDFRFARRFAGGGDIGMGESYFMGEWDSPDVTEFIRLFAVNAQMIQNLLVDRPIARWVQQFRHWLNKNTKKRARKNIHAHYDLGNRFYESWLDQTMTYSSGIFEPGDNDLSTAQLRKYRSLASKIDLRPEHHLLEIGCGWGGFAEFAARDIGCRVTGLTISQEQFDFAKQRIAAAGLADLVTLKLQDYRDEKGAYDRIASIEMFEAVGEAYWPTYFRQIDQRLKPGGSAGIQVIMIQDQFFESYRREIDFIRRYVFPGGMLPSPTALANVTTRAGLTLKTETIFGLDYAHTLAQWRDRFREAWPTLTPLGFDERFRRLWEYYLSYCEAGFRAGTIDVRQLVYVKSS
jgi:cyclopropane-fatty-acyl-phospholipid synthase